MKHFLFWIGFLLLIASCSSQKNVIREERNTDKEVVDKNVEYGMKTSNSKFANWYLNYKDSETYKSQHFYEDWNIKYVTAWNRKVSGSKKNKIFVSGIEYSSGIDYGFELNHELFYYFQYVEHVLRIKIMQGGPDLVNF